MHVHNFYGGTSYDYNHLHLYSGTSGAAPDDQYHTHLISVRTTVDLMHDHIIQVQTGPPIQTQWGHIHLFSGETTVNGTPPHSHHFRNVTFPVQL